MEFLLFIFFLITSICSEKKDLLNENKRNLQSSLNSLQESDTYENIRIYVNHNCLTGTTDSDILIEAIEKAKKTLEKLIKVKRLKSDQLNLNDFSPYLSSYYRDCAGSLYEFPKTDLFIFVRKSPEIFSGVLDFDSPVIFYHLNNDKSKRPILGGVTFSSDTKALKDRNGKIQAISTIFLHEFTHILGFNKTIMEMKGLIKLEDTTKRMNDKYYKKYSFTGSQALEKAKLYFNCKEMTSIELDYANGNENDDSIIHWHSRILMGDYMTPGLYYIDQAISEITLAALVDLGYYQVNYYTGGLMRFGKNKGCKFLDGKQDCIEEYEATDVSTAGLKTTFPNEFCSSIYQKVGQIFGVCSPGRQSMAFCFNDVRNDYFANKYKNYNRSFIHGSDIKGFSPTELIEFCPYSFSDFNAIEPIYDYDGYCNFGYSKYGYKNIIIYI